MCVVSPLPAPEILRRGEQPPRTQRTRRGGMRDRHVCTCTVGEQCTVDAPAVARSLLARLAFDGGASAAAHAFRLRTPRLYQCSGACCRCWVPRAPYCRETSDSRSAALTEHGRRAGAVDAGDTISPSRRSVSDKRALFLDAQRRSQQVHPHVLRASQVRPPNDARHTRFKKTLRRARTIVNHWRAHAGKRSSPGPPNVTKSHGLCPCKGARPRCLARVVGHSGAKAAHETDIHVFRVARAGGSA